MKLPKNIARSVGMILSIVALAGPAWSAEQAGTKDGSSKKSSSKPLSQSVEETRDSINEGWKKLTDPKTVEPARNKINEAYKELSDAAGAAVGSSDKSKKGK